MATQPSVQIHLAATIRTEWMQLAIRGFAAHGARLALGEGNDFRHRL